VTLFSSEIQNSIGRFDLLDQPSFGYIDGSPQSKCISLIENTPFLLSLSVLNYIHIYNYAHLAEVKKIPMSQFFSRVLYISSFPEKNWFVVGDSYKVLLFNYDRGAFERALDYEFK
jgi:hypothetical protein